jgi:hypothetical protein
MDRAKLALERLEGEDMWTGGLEVGYPQYLSGVNWLAYTKW